MRIGMDAGRGQIALHLRAGRLAEAGMGFVLLPRLVVKDGLATGRLVPVLPDWQGVPQAIHAVTETRLIPACAQRFIEFLRERLKEA